MSGMTARNMLEMRYKNNYLGCLEWIPMPFQIKLAVTNARCGSVYLGKHPF